MGTEASEALASMMTVLATTFMLLLMVLLGLRGYAKGNPVESCPAS